MHKLKDMIVKEIDEIEQSGITKSNIGVLSELVDMYKDLCNVKYWESKVEYYDSKAESAEHDYDHRDGKSWHKEERMKHHEYEHNREKNHKALVDGLKRLNERLKNTDSPKDKSEFDAVADELLSMAEDICVAMKTVALDDKESMRMRSIFK